MNQYLNTVSFAQLEMEVRRLKNEMERVNEKQRDSVGEQSRRLAEVKFSLS